MLLNIFSNIEMNISLKFEVLISKNIGENVTK